MRILKDIDNQYPFFWDIIGKSMMVLNKFHAGLLESAYESGLKYLLELDGYHVEQQAMLPMFWDDVRLDKNYRMDLVVNNKIILELKAIQNVGFPCRQQLMSYLHLTHMPYGMILNFHEKGLYSECYIRMPDSEIIRVMKT